MLLIKKILQNCAISPKGKYYSSTGKAWAVCSKMPIFKNTPPPPIPTIRKASSSSDGSFVNKKILFAILVFLPGLKHVEASDIGSSVSADNCTFYKTFSEPVDCRDYDKQSYTRTYGLKYCSAFLSKDNDWSLELKNWRKKTSVCLQEMLRDNPKRIAPGCDQLLEFAFDTHPICYKQAGICDLSPSDQLQILATVSVEDVLQNRRDSFIQFLNVTLACVANVWTPAIKDLFSRVFDGTRGDNILQQQGAMILSFMPVDSQHEADDFALSVLPTLIFDKPFTGGSSLVLEMNNRGSLEGRNSAIYAYKPLDKQTFVRSIEALPEISQDVRTKAAANYSEKPSPSQIRAALEAAKAYGKK